MYENNQTTARLILSDGSEFLGKSFGKRGTAVGEIVFTTSMTGYLETLTDPSYFGQIVVQTFPLIGNYGVSEADSESKKAWPSGYVVRELCQNPSNFRSQKSLNQWLGEQGVLSIWGIDTRKLTRKIREKGVMNCAITTEKYIDKSDILNRIRKFKIKDAIKSVSTKTQREYQDFSNISKPFEKYIGQKKNFKICLMDFGAKQNIIRSLLQRGASVITLPHNATAQQIKRLKPDGIMLSNGPGDPAENVEIVSNLKKIQKLGVPIFGICLGHQLLALANGAKTKKLKYGHRGANQPVIDKTLGKTFITSQNHGYAVVEESLEQDVATVSHYNANDKTCEGIEYKKIPAFTVQFHPEACAGPLDTSYLFDRFFRLIEKNKNQKENFRICR